MEIKTSRGFGPRRFPSHWEDWMLIWSLFVFGVAPYAMVVHFMCNPIEVKSDLGR